jgi:lipid-binding SYLF domain-containing protein
MVTSSSVFILCINTQEAVKQIKNIAKSKDWTLETHVRIENGKLGVRIWRVL